MTVLLFTNADDIDLYTLYSRSISSKEHDPEKTWTLSNDLNSLMIGIKGLEKRLITCSPLIKFQDIIKEQSLSGSMRYSVYTKKKNLCYILNRKVLSWMGAD